MVRMDLTQNVILVLDYLVSDFLEVLYELTKLSMLIQNFYHCFSTLKLMGVN